MQLVNLIGLRAGGPGSGCDPDAARRAGNKCGRPPEKGEVKPYKDIYVHQAEKTDRDELRDTVDDWRKLTDPRKKKFDEALHSVDMAEGILDAVGRWADPERILFVQDLEEGDEIVALAYFTEFERKFFVNYMAVHPRIVQGLQPDNTNAGRRLIKALMQKAKDAKKDLQWDRAKVGIGEGVSQRMDEYTLPYSRLKTLNIAQLRFSVLGSYSRHPKIEANKKLQGRTGFQGLDISIENRKGSIRRGPGWQTKMRVPYGYIRRTEGTDGDQVDVFLGPKANALYAYVIHILDPKTGTYDEDKVMLGFPSSGAAKRAIRQHYDSPDYYGWMTVMPMAKFKAQVMKTKDRPGMVAEAERPPTVCVDFDGVLSEYHGWKGIGVFGKPIKAGLDLVRQLKDSGYQVIIFTAREETTLVGQWLKERGLEVDGVTNKKPPAVAYIDDRAVAWTGGAKKAVKEVGRLEKVNESA